MTSHAAKAVSGRCFGRRVVGRMVVFGWLLDRKPHTGGRGGGRVLFALVRTFGCVQRSVDDVVGGFGHRAIAVGGGVGMGVVQGRKAGETPLANDSDKSVTSVTGAVLVVETVCGGVRSREAAGARGQAWESPVSAAGKGS